MIDLRINQPTAASACVSHLDPSGRQEGASVAEALHAAVETHVRAIRDAVGDIERHLSAKGHAGAA